MQVESNLSQAPLRGMFLGNEPCTANSSLIILGSTDTLQKICQLPPSQRAETDTIDYRGERPNRQNLINALRSFFAPVGEKIR